MRVERVIQALLPCPCDGLGRLVRPCHNYFDVTSLVVKNEREDGGGRKERVGVHKVSERDVFVRSIVHVPSNALVFDH